MVLIPCPCNLPPHRVTWGKSRYSPPPPLPHTPLHPGLRGGAFVLLDESGSSQNSVLPGV